MRRKLIALAFAAATIVWPLAGPASADHGESHGPSSRACGTTGGVEPCDTCTVYNLPPPCIPL